MNEEQAKEEAKFFLKTVAGKKFEYPLVIDVEEREIAGAGKKNLTDAVIAFCEAVENAGYYISVYANPSWLNSYLDSTRLTPYDLWLAHWDISEPSRGCGIWQYTSSGTVDGISGRVDMNLSYKDYPSMMIGMGLNGYTAPVAPPPPPPPEQYKIHVVTKGESPWSLASRYLGDGRRYREIVSLNGLRTGMLYVGQRLKIPNK